MSTIPRWLLKLMETHPEYRAGYCVFHRTVHPPSLKVERHHNLIFAHKQVQALFCILQICVFVHDKARNTEVREKLDWIMLNRATKEEIAYYSKAVDLTQRLKYLNQKFGPYGTHKTN